MNRSALYCFLAIGFTFALITSHREARAANYPLEIIQPKAGLDTRCRHYRAYPNLPYEVRLAVIGGAYPLSYELTTAPSGMSIDSDKGIITWAAPPASATPYAVTVRVTDAEGTAVSRSWTITVTASGFYFLDSVNGRTVGSGGTGTIQNPWRTIQDMYQGNDVASKGLTAYADGFLYFRAGTYTTDGFLENICTDGLPSRMPLVGHQKPLVWMAYPGETPTLDLSTAYIQLYGGTDNFYFSGFNVVNIVNCLRYGIRIDSDTDNITFYKNTFHGLTPLAGTNNQSAIMISRGDRVGSSWAFQNNEFYDIRHGYGILGYLTTKVLVEDNVFHDINDPLGIGMAHAIGPKQTTTMWFIRGNHVYDIVGDAIWIHYNNNYGDCGDIDVSFNLCQNLESAGNESRSLWVGQSNNAGGIVNVYRNTFIGGRCMFSNVDATKGPFNFYQNVIVNNENAPDHVGCDSCGDPAQLIRTNNLSGFPADNVVDTNGNLTSSYGQYLGTRGYQISASNDTVPPAATTDLRPR